MFAEATSRQPAPNELATLQRALGRERAMFETAPDRARSLLSIGEAPRDEALAPREHAAWTQVATLLLNLSETITKN
jgi:hypothetical protein